MKQIQSYLKTLTDNGEIEIAGRVEARLLGNISSTVLFALINGTTADLISDMQVSLLALANEMGIDLEEETKKKIKEETIISNS